MARATQPASPVTAFNEALWRHDDAAIARLAPQIDPNAVDRWHRAPLAMAAQYGELPTVRRLLARGARPDADRRCLTPITYAARRGAVDIVDALRDAGATMSIATSIYLGDRAAVSRALASMAATTVDEEATPLLLHAAESLHADIVVLLLDAGADLAAADRFGETALHRVADLRRADDQRAAGVAALLVDRGAQVDARNRDEVTPLHQAVRARNLAVVELLLARGADANARDKRGSTPLHRAISPTGASGTAGVDAAPFVAALLAHGANPDQRDTRGRSPRAAAKRGVLDPTPRRRSAR
ncbi:MAG TPA: ankyrin repeat domain-containing protein [Kofleriaceae bacterium]|jgi:cytohesin|nr:ankyrin repeat domain-containing protein [Kofleriaceae bacterium]